MFFTNKGKLRKKYDESLKHSLEKLRDEWQMKKNFNDKSIDPSEEVIIDFKLTEMKYFILIREAKQRKLKFFSR
ncbi:MAG: hypothetical protein K0S51_2652 [Bacillales bacterium]|jgi:hypothetical protein|nr:hypothetical protein [Bacillales bacterium]